MKNLDRVVPLKQELDLLDSYLYIEKERFGDRLQINWEIDEINNVMIPPLSIHTLVENAVNHGVLEQIAGGTIVIRVCKEGDHTKISVIDDGVGMNEEKMKQIFSSQHNQKRGIGIINTEQRLKRLYGKGLDVISTPGIGTTMSFTIPNHE